MLDFLIDYTDGFEIYFKYPSDYPFGKDNSEFYDSVSYMKSYFLNFNPVTNGWMVFDKKIEEIIMWFDKHNITYSLSQKVINKLNELKDNLYFSDKIYSRKRKFDYSTLNSNIKLFEFQKKAIAWRMRRSSYLDAYDAGLGKSCINICVMATLLKMNVIDSALIIVPSGLSYHWKREILFFINNIIEDDIILIDNKNKRQLFEMFIDKKIIIVPNHLLHHVILSYKKGYKFGKSAKKIRWKQFVNIKKSWKKKNPLLLIDESHTFKSTDTVRYKALNTILDSFSYRFLLSATPSINHIENIYSQLHIIDKSIIPMSENAFKIWLANSIGDKWNPYKIQEYNTEHIEILKEAYKKFVSQKLKEDVPEMRVKRIQKPFYVKMTPTQQILYENVSKEILHKIEEEYDNLTWQLVINKLPYICHAIDNPLLLKDNTWSNVTINKILDKWKIEDDPKFQLLKSRVTDYVDGQGEKLIVFDVHPSTLNILAEKFKKYKPLVIHGGITGEKERQNMIDKFNNSEENRIFFLSILTSSAGLNLQYKCRRIIFYTISWDVTLTRQAMDRTHRITSNKNSIIEFFIVDKTIDNLRYNRTINRIIYNDNLNKNISKQELISVLQGII